MHYQLNLLLTNTPASMERVLQVTRYRGFSIEQCEMYTASGAMRLNMQVSGEQPIQRLTSQLNKLYDLIELACDSVIGHVDVLMKEPVEQLAMG
ncbi:acetolactate synthase 2 small subunit [Neptunicella sp.]|uniref:acetolactate synthase 2 small subunit n=1 Tax=Neptunicella sp. TaxID=2125986 RepID=UPI003F691BF2